MPRTVALFVLLALTAIVGYEVCRIPVQVSDSVGNLLQVQHQSVGDVFVAQFSNGAYVRPLLWTQIKLAAAFGVGREPLVFKTIHVIQLLLLALLFWRLLDVRSPSDAVAAVLAALVLFGLHTFDGLVREAFPINSFLTIALCVLAAMNLATGPPARWRDLAAVVLLIAAVLTIESGVLVVAAIVAARLVGLKGVSWKGVAATVVVCGVYLAGRVALGVGSPGLAERPSGFGFQVLEPAQLVARFGAHPWIFYAYNVVSSFVSVLLAEPRAGVWWATHGLTNGDLLPAWLTINIVASLLATVLLVVPAHIAQFRWRQGLARPRDQLLLVSLAVLVSNAAVSFGYTKDVIMSAGGVCFALAVYAAAATLLATLVAPAPRRVLIAVTAAAMVLWTIRAVALPYRLEQQVDVVKRDWAEVDAWFDRQHIQVDSPEAQALVARLRRSALRARPRPVAWTGWRQILDLN